MRWYTPKESSLGRNISLQEEDRLGTIVTKTVLADWKEVTGDTRNQLLIYKAIIKPVWTLTAYCTFQPTNSVTLPNKVLRTISSIPWHVSYGVITACLYISSVKQEILCQLLLKTHQTAPICRWSSVQAENSCQMKLWIDLID